jgi:hypothetical protein
MKQADDVIRKGLIALLCIGDPIHLLNIGQHGPGYIYNTVKIYYIIEFTNAKRIRVGSKSEEFSVDLKYINPHKGELWICFGLREHKKYEQVLEELALEI